MSVKPHHVVVVFKSLSSLKTTKTATMVMIHGHGPISLTFLSVKGERRCASVLTFLSEKTDSLSQEASQRVLLLTRMSVKAMGLIETPWRRAGFTDIFVSETKELRREARMASDLTDISVSKIRRPG